MPKSSQEPPASSKAPYHGLKDMDDLYNFKVKIENQNLEHESIKHHWQYKNQDPNTKPQSGTSRILHQPKPGLKEKGCSLHLQNHDREPKFGSWVSQTPLNIYINKEIVANPQSGTCSILQCPKWALGGIGCPLHLQDQDGEKFRYWMYQRPVTIFKSR